MSEAVLDAPGGDPGSAASVGTALEAALRLRAPGMYASTPLVCQLAGRVGRDLGLDTQSQALLDLAARVRDIGMVGLPDSVILATTPLSPDDWTLLNRHPVIGEQLLEELFVVSGAAGIVRSHHERWDGGGYPDGLLGDEIPLLSRVIAVCDAFVATASDRPHRRGLGAEAAHGLVHRESGTQFDPATVAALASVLSGPGGLTLTPEDGPAPMPGNGLAPTPGEDLAPARAPARHSGGAGGNGRPSSRRANDGRIDLSKAIAEFDVVPALAPAYERLLAATASSGTLTAELVAAVESDTGLTVAVLRRAQTLGRQRPIATVADAVVALGPAGIADAVKSLPRAEFPWRTSQIGVLMHRSLVHAQAVARATNRIARELKLAERDDVLVAALLHDVGKLVLGRAVAHYVDATDATTTPEERVRHEQRTWGVDHASLGGLLLRRWGLPERLAATVAAHHSAEAERDVATYVRLADMVAHHAQGETVDRGKMLDLARLCNLSARALREILFDLPHSAGSDRRRAEPSPLSDRETAVLRTLAEGKAYKRIGFELGVSASTVGSHLQKVYAKLGVDDRAQAVLRAAERGWI